jgi:glucose/arabinose dehydrogenase
MKMMTIIDNVNLLKPKSFTNRSYVNKLANKQCIKLLVSLCVIFFGLISLTTGAQTQINWTHCAGENNTCRFTGTKVVRYGAGSSWAQGIYINSVACSNSVFGDPIRGTYKSCQITEPQWTTCANQDEICRFSGKKIVRYGLNTRWRQGEFTDQVACTNNVFGNPANGVRKICQIASANVDTVAPTPPRGLAISNLTCNSGVLSWMASTASMGVTAYDIYHDGQHMLRVPGTRLNANLTLSPGAKWGLYVNAVDTAGNVSQASETLPINVPQCQVDTIPPSVPTSLTGNTSGTTATLSWSASTDNVAVTAYDIYRDGKKVGSTAELTYTESGLTPNTAYQYTVAARDAQQNASQPSNAISLTTGSTCSTSVCSVEQVVTETDLPWGLVPLQDGSILYGRRDAHEIVRVVDGVKTTVGTVPNIASTDGEGGLLGLAVTKDFPATDPWIYIYHTSATDNRIVRMQYKDEALVPSTYQVLVTGIGRNKYHNGGRLRFGPDGKLYATTGDAQAPETAQDLDSLNGKILRINADGSVPSDNPYNNYVWTYGHRNPQGIAFDSQGRLWQQEFGNSVSDETNLLEKGGNYGWPNCEGTTSQSGEGCATAGFKAPKRTYPVAQASCSGVAVVNDVLYVACLRGNRVYRTVINGDSLADSEQLFVGTYFRLRTIEPTVDGDGLWMTTSTTGDKDSIADNSNEKIFKVYLSR